MATAILGAGILGTCAALELADRGHGVCLFDRNPLPLSEASLYNEGKLHLGFVWAADPTFRTAERMLSGAKVFMDVVGRWVTTADLRALIARPFDYLVHRDTMVSVDRVDAHFHRVARAVTDSISRGTVGPLDPSRPVLRRLDAAALAARYDPATVLAAYETAEIAVDTWSLAACLRQAIQAHPRIELMAPMRVVKVESLRPGGFTVIVDDDGSRSVGPFTTVVNALWANRAIVDERSGLPGPTSWMVRRKVGVNFTSGVVSPPPSLTAVLGPFGDVVSFGSGRVFLSWYPCCMIGRSTTTEETDWATTLHAVNREQVALDTVDALAGLCPAVKPLRAMAHAAIVNGGFICAAGETDIDDPASRLHERLGAAINARDGYLSVDTSKFTTGPAFAVQVADRVEAVAGALA